MGKSSAAGLVNAVLRRAAAYDLTVEHYSNETERLCVEYSVSPQIAGDVYQRPEILSTKPLKVACASGALTLLEVVPEGSRPMEGSAWAAGRRFTNGDKLQ